MDFVVAGKTLVTVSTNGFTTLWWALSFKYCSTCSFKDAVLGYLLKFSMILVHLVKISMFLSIAGNFCSLSFEAKTLNLVGQDLCGVIKSSFAVEISSFA